MTSAGKKESVASEHQHQEPGIQSGDQGGDEPGERLKPWAVDEFAHLFAASGEDNQWNDGEAQLQGENHLADQQEFLRSLLQAHIRTFPAECRTRLRGR